MPDASLDALRAELAAPMPHPDAEAIQRWGAQTLRWVIDHFTTVPHQGIGLTAGRSEMERLLNGPPPETANDFAAVLADFEHKVVPYAYRINHPRFLAFVPGSPSFFSVLGEMLCAGTNFFTGVWLEAAGPGQVELTVLEWFRSWLGMPPSTRGLLTSGGSEANLTAFVAARESLSLDERGRAVLYCADHAHRSVDRAARIMGLLPDQIRHVPVDRDYRLSAESVRAAVRGDRARGRRPWALAATAGSTHTGTVDPLSSLADLCAAERLWLHVDAAYGWPAVLAPEYAASLDGIGRADSVTLDPHKWFGQCYDAGCVLVRDGRLLFDAFATHADYTTDVEAGDDTINFADHGIALSRRFRALKIWLSVNALGLGWYRDLVRRGCLLATLAQHLLEASGCFQILCPRRLSIVCFRYRPPGFVVSGPADERVLDDWNRRVLDGLRDGGEAFLSSTRLESRLALRMCFVNWRTTAADVEKVVAWLQALGNAAYADQMPPEG